VAPVDVRGGRPLADVIDLILSERAAVIEPIHLRRLAEIAARDRERFLLGHPEYRRRLVAVVLAQGAAQHYDDMLRGKPHPKGVKDIDVWSFFAAIPGNRFPANRRYTYADFGPSSLGRQRFRTTGITESHRRRIRKWQAYEGRRVDLFLRALPVRVHADPVDAIRDWLTDGATYVTGRSLHRGHGSPCRPSCLWNRPQDHGAVGVGFEPTRGLHP
jgi:hypothetical protein